MKKSNALKRVFLALLCVALLASACLTTALGEAKTYHFPNFDFYGMTFNALPNGFGAWENSNGYPSFGTMKDAKVNGLYATVYAAEDKAEETRALSIAKYVDDSYEWYYMFLLDGTISYNAFTNGVRSLERQRTPVGNLIEIAYDEKGEEVSRTLLNESDVTDPMLTGGITKFDKQENDEGVTYKILYPDSDFKGPSITVYKDGRYSVYTAVDTVGYYYAVKNDYFTIGTWNANNREWGKDTAWVYCNGTKEPMNQGETPITTVFDME